MHSYGKAQYRHFCSRVWSHLIKERTIFEVHWGGGWDRDRGTGWTFLIPYFVGAYNKGGELRLLHNLLLSVIGFNVVSSSTWIGLSPQPRFAADRTWAVIVCHTVWCLLSISGYICTLSWLFELALVSICHFLYVLCTHTRESVGFVYQFHAIFSFNIQTFDGLKGPTLNHYRKDVIFFENYWMSLILSAAVRCCW